MMLKTKLFTAILFGCALVLAFTICAGCTISGSSDPIIGTWIPEGSNIPDSGTVVVFKQNGAFSMFAVNNLNTNPVIDRVYITGKWVKEDDNVYILKVKGTSSDYKLTASTFSNILKIPGYYPNFKKDDSINISN